MTVVQIDEFFADYARAFVDQDIGGICSFGGIRRFLSSKDDTFR
jgi:hypothetical protein